MNHADANRGDELRELIITQMDGVLTMTINRPERKNALSLSLCEKLLIELERAATEPSIGAVVLTGSGSDFCAGGDVKQMATQAKLPSDSRVRAMRARTRLIELLHNMPKPTIAMLRGNAVGAGLSLALACDLRIADTSIRLSTGFVKRALSGDYGGHYFLPRLVGMAKARELYLLSETLDAQEALRIGLVNKVVSPDTLVSQVQQITQTLAAGPSFAIGQIKANLNQSLHSSLGEMLDAEAVRQITCTETDEHKEAVSAFIEKRPPTFRMVSEAGRSKP